MICGLMSLPDDEAQNASRLLQQRMAEIGVRLLARSQQDVEEMAQLVLRIREGAPGAPVALKQLAHRINGAAAALGFPALSTHAGHVEGFAATAAAGPGLSETARAIELEIAALRKTLKSLQR